MLITIVVILALLWAFGFAVDIGGGMIHILLIAALGVFLYNMLSSRQKV